MPIYEYRCTACEDKFELLRPMSQADAEATCPRCNNGARRVLSMFAAVSKGPGGESAPISGSSGCSSCSSSSCSSCH